MHTLHKVKLHSEIAPKDMQLHLGFQLKCRAFLRCYYLQPDFIIFHVLPPSGVGNVTFPTLFGQTEVNTFSDQSTNICQFSPIPSGPLIQQALVLILKSCINYFGLHLSQMSHNAEYFLSCCDLRKLLFPFD